jgi:uncharacterized protein affecting Mg2+/Co2+ transport
LKLLSPTDTAISVTVYDNERQPALARFFESPEDARLATYSIVLTNTSTRAIVGVAVRWVTTDATGQSRTTTQSFDSFGTSVAARQPVIPAGTELIATPNGFQQVKAPSGGGVIFGAGRAGGVSNFGFGRGRLVRIDDLDQAQTVMATVDTIIFEDGRVIGADESHLVDYINTFTGAVRSLVQSVRDAVSLGSDADDVLRNIVSIARTQSGGTSGPDASVGIRFEAQLLLGLAAEQTSGRLNQLEELPPPPKFYR